jgi:hypothetical protein
MQMQGHAITTLFEAAPLRVAQGRQFPQTPADGVNINGDACQLIGMKPSRLETTEDLPSR